MFAVIQFICNRFIVSCKYTLLMIPSFLPAVQLSPKTARPRHFKLFGRWGAPSRSRSDPTHRWKKFHRCIPRRMPIYLEEFVSRGITVNIDHWRAGEMFCCHPFFWLVTTRLCGCVCGIFCLRNGKKTSCKPCKIDHFPQLQIQWFVLLKTHPCKTNDFCFGYLQNLVFYVKHLGDQLKHQGDQLHNAHVEIFTMFFFTWWRSDILGTDPRVGKPSRFDLVDSCKQKRGNSTLEQQATCNKPFEQWWIQMALKPLPTESSEPYVHQWTLVATFAAWSWRSPGLVRLPWSSSFIKF